MDTFDSDETQDGKADETNFYNEENLENTASLIYTQGRERGKWVVNVISSDGTVTVEHLTAQDVWGMDNRRVILDIGPHNQPEDGSGGIFGTWLGMLSTDLNKFPINYVDWRKIQSWRKDDVWDFIQSKFFFDASNENFKKYVMKSLSQKCRGHKTRLWKSCHRNTPEETIEARREFIPKEQWQDFVHQQFGDKAKEQLTEKMTENAPNTSGNNTSASSNDAFLQVFGAECPGRVRCVGLGPTPSSFFHKRTIPASNESEVISLRNRVHELEEKLVRMNDLEDKVEKMNDIICRFATSSTSNDER
ncbi:unnamed protein product [Microthlaspi erraticum]|nr:unnamed protein product [Microthlaspi erraticum]